MKATIIRFLRENLQQIEVTWRENLQKNYPELYKDSLHQQITERSIKQSIEILSEYCQTGDFEKMVEALVNLEKPANQLFKFYEIFETSTYDVLISREDKTPQEMLEILNVIRVIKKRISLFFVEQYEEKYQNIIQLQKVNLQELSTPIMPILEKIIVLPIIGVVDAERSKLLMENILNSVVEKKAEIILIDITGVPFVDSTVAFHLLQLVNALHIIGAKGMLVGIKPEIAQTFVDLSIDLSKIITLGTLQEGIELALKYTNRQISEVKLDGF
ncbi:MAG: STAS domain-containing protein [Kurthia sp.]|nr:STAS domain-containing protein [Candidatus Kurthia equi]